MIARVVISQSGAGFDFELIDSNGASSGISQEYKTVREASIAWGSHRESLLKGDEACTASFLESLQRGEVVVETKE